MQHPSVGIREAKIQLSRLLKNVQQGKEVIITDRGKPVGKIVPISKDSLPVAERIRDLERNGWIEPLSQKEKLKKELPSPIPVPGDLAQKFLQEDRS